MQRQTGVASGSLSIHPCEAEVLWRNPPDRRSVPGMETTDRAPNVGSGSAIIHEERVRSAAPSEEIRTRAAVQDIDAATSCNRIISAATMDEPIGGADADIQAVRSDVDVLICSPLTGPVYGCPVADTG